MPDLALLIELSGPAHLFVGFFIILCIYTGAWSFTYWISKDE